MHVNNGIVRWKGPIVDMILGKAHLITTIDLVALYFDDFLSYIFMKSNSIDGIIRINVKLR